MIRCGPVAEKTKGLAVKNPILLFGRGPNRVMEMACFDVNVQ